MPARRFTPIINPRDLTTDRGKILRRCGKCDAGPGHLCGRWTGLGYWQTQKTFHKQR